MSNHLVTLFRIWPTRDLNLRPPALEMNANALLLEKLVDFQIKLHTVLKKYCISKMLLRGF